MPRIDRLFVQLTPRPGNGILENTDEMKYIDPADLWMERNTSYSYLMRELTSTTPRTNWGLLRVFESGDAADREAWDNAVQYLDSSGIQGWKVEREGVFVKHTDTNQSTVQSDDTNGHADGFADMANSNLLLVLTLSIRIPGTWPIPLLVSHTQHMRHTRSTAWTFTVTIDLFCLVDVLVYLFGRLKQTGAGF